MRGMLVIAALVTAPPALAAPNTAAFKRYWEAKVPVATCACMAVEMSRTRQGQVALDSARVIELPAAQQYPAAKEMADKYGLKLSEINATLQSLDPYMQQVAERCL